MNRLTRILLISILVGVGATASAQNYTKVLLVNGSNTMTLVPGSLASNRVDTLTDVGMNTRFIMASSTGGQYIDGNLRLTGTINLSALTASKPLKLDASKNIISAAIDLTTDVAGVLPAANGGMGLSSLTANGVLAVNSTGDGFVMLTGAQYGVLVMGTGGVPEIGTVNLASDVAVSGVLPVIHGGTGASTLLSNAVLYGNGTGVVSNTGVSTVDGSFLQTTTAGAAPSWASVLGVANGGTNISSYTLGDILYASAATTISKLPGNTTTTLKYLTQTGDGSASAAPVWAELTTSDLPLTDVPHGGTGLTTLTQYGVLVGNGTSAVSVTAAGTATTQVLHSGGGAGNPTFGAIVNADLPVVDIAHGGTNSSTALNNGRVMVSSGGAIVELAASTAAGQFLQTTAAGDPASWKTVLDIANGGTNLSALGTANQVLGINAGATGLEYKTVTAGSGITVTQAAGSITIAATGGVSSYEEVSATAGALTIGGTKTVVTILDDGSGAIALSLPGSGTNGQMLTVYNNDADDTTGVIIGSKMAVTFVYTGPTGSAGWRRIVP